MKKISAISLAVFYLFISAGLDINIHRCMGRVESIAILSQKGCCCDSSIGNQGCCSNQNISVKIPADQQVSLLPKISHKGGVELASIYPILKNFQVTHDLCVAKPLSRPPPQKKNLPVLLCELIYYA